MGGKTKKYKYITISETERLALQYMFTLKIKDEFFEKTVKAVIAKLLLRSEHK